MCTVSAAIALCAVPYPLLDADAALVEVFDVVDAPGCRRVVVLGALAGLTVSMFGTMFSLPRIVYAMAKDGLIFKWVQGHWLTLCLQWVLPHIQVGAGSLAHPLFAMGASSYSSGCMVTG